MTDLSAIFTSKAFSPAQPSYRNTAPRPLISPFATNIRNQNTYKSQQYGQSTRVKSSYKDIPISNQAKKIITFDNLQQQATWFESQNFLECLIKIAIATFGFLLPYYADKLSMNTMLCWIVFTFLLLGLQHNIFGATTFNTWVNCSLIGTTLVLANQIFLHVINRISPKSAATLFYTHQSLIPSAYVTVLIMIVFYSFPLLAQPTPRSILQNILGYVPNLFQLFKLIYKLKIAIFQAYSLMLIITAVISLLYIWQDDGDFQDYSNLFTNIFNPFALISQIITFFWILIVMHFILRIISGSVTKVAIEILYNAKNKDTKLPMILQLLRISPSDRFLTTQQQSNKLSLLPLVKLMKFDFSLSKKERMFSRNQLQNLYKHSLTWLKDILTINPTALSTRISISKFYHTYFDIFKQFSQAELNRCAGCLYELSRQIENLNNMKQRPKKFSQDIFFWAKIIKKQFQIWGKAVQSCRYLKIADLIMEIISLSDMDRELWTQSQIGRNLSQINNLTSELAKQNVKLNPAISEKLEQYYNKTKRVLNQ